MASALRAADVGDLLRAAQQGDESALSDLFAVSRRYLSPLASTRITQRLRSKTDASDLVQTALLEAHRHCPETSQQLDFCRGCSADGPVGRQRRKAVGPRAATFAGSFGGEPMKRDHRSQWHVEDVSGTNSQDPRVVAAVQEYLTALESGK